MRPIKTAPEDSPTLLNRGAPAPTRTETPIWAQALNLPRMPIPPQGHDSPQLYEGSECLSTFS